MRHLMILHGKVCWGGTGRNPASEPLGDNETKCERSSRCCAAWKRRLPYRKHRRLRSTFNTIQSMSRSSLIHLFSAILLTNGIARPACAATEDLALQPDEQHLPKR